jgi:hypothetical protein
MRRIVALPVAFFALATALVLWAATAAAGPNPSRINKTQPPFAEPSSAFELRDVELGTNVTECPQAGMNTEPDPLARIEKDLVWRLSERGDDTRANTEYACFPQNETTLAFNPTNSRNIIGAQNDYRMGGSFNGIDATRDGGKHWYDLIGPFPSLPNGETLDSAGDPALAFDREGTAYYASIDFNRTDDTNGIWVNRSTNGGFTWSRGCVAIDASDPANPTDDVARCGGPGDPRQPGDGTVVFQPENEPKPPFPASVANFSVTFHDKEYIAAGPRPAGVAPRCFAPETKTPIPPGAPGCPAAYIGPDRVYVTWTAFNNPTGVPRAVVSATIEVSYSDDRGRSWSPRRTINGNAPFCRGLVSPQACDDNQFSVPTVSPHTGHVYVAFENFNVPDENQWLVVRSRDGGATWEGPFFITPTFDVNYRARADCEARGHFGGAFTNSCFRIPQTGAIVVDRRGGAFADDLYLVMADNRNGTRESTNNDVFFFKSTNGGSSWVGPTRVNDDPSAQPANRNCGRDLDGPMGPLPPEPACPAGVHTGNDQWWPWIDISDSGDVNIKMLDRRLDTNSVAHEWPTSRQRPGNYLVWTWAAQCRVSASTMTPGQGCVAPTAAVIPQPTAPQDQGNALLPEQTVFPFRNFKVSDVPSNFDYCFRAGIFCGDYESIAVSHGRDHGDDDDNGGGARAAVLFTDARNGRSSGGPAGGTTFPSQPGRNPACEQSDVFFDSFSARNGGRGGSAGPITPFLVTPCPGDENGNGDPDDD